MDMVREALARAQWVSGPAFRYGPDDAGYYDEKDEGHRTHVVSRGFELPAGWAAAGGVTLAVAVLGLARVRVNGRALGDFELMGYWTRYDRLVYYDTLDVSDCLRAGENTIEIELGNGFYNPAPLTLFGKYNLRERLAEVGTPQVAAALVQGGEPLLVTDGTWRLSCGQLIFNNLYLGEVRDLAYEPAEEGPVTVAGAAGSRELAPSPVPPCRRCGAVGPASVTAAPVMTADGAAAPGPLSPDAAPAATAGVGTLVDFGEMVAGTVEIAFHARAGQRVELVYAEVCEDGRIRCDSNVAGLVGMTTPSGVCPGGPGAPSPAVQRDVLLCGEGENAYASTFTYHSFRYVLVRGLPPDALEGVRAVYVHTDLARTGAISCGNEDYDRLMDAAVRTKLNNVHGVLEDCSRERFGYGGDMVSLANSNLMLLDEEGLLDKTLGDLSRDQTARGGLPETAPFMGIGSNGPAYGEGPLLWQLAYPYLAVQADRYYGRRDLIEREWPGLERFGGYLLSFDPEELAGHCLGDHGSVLTGGAEGFRGGTPDKPLLGWCAILWCLECTAEAGGRIGRDVGRLSAAAGVLRERIAARFGHKDGSFGDGTQSACAFAGMLGLGDPKRQAELLAADFRARGNVLTTGIFGTMLAFDLLNRTGHNDVAEAWLTRREHPSLLAMLEGGSGALAEQFTEDLSSYDHAMFSSYAQWLMQALGGIRVADDARGADRIVVAPYFSPLTDRVTCSYRTPAGEVSVMWYREGFRHTVVVGAPAGVTLDTSALEGDDAVTLVTRAGEEHVDRP